LKRVLPPADSPGLTTRRATPCGVSTGSPSWLRTGRTVRALFRSEHIGILLQKAGRSRESDRELPRRGAVSGPRGARNLPNLRRQRLRDGARPPSEETAIHEAELAVVRAGSFCLVTNLYPLHTHAFLRASARAPRRRLVSRLSQGSEEELLVHWLPLVGSKIMDEYQVYRGPSERSSRTASVGPPACE